MSNINWKAKFYLAAGFASLGVGVIGIWTPLLPTTEFLLLAAFCFARSSPRWHEWLLTHHLFGPYIHAFRSRHGLTKTQKWHIAAMVTLTICITEIFVRSWWLHLLVGLIWLACIIFLLLSRTAAPAPKLQPKPADQIEQ